MKHFIVKNIASFLELDECITEIASNQTKILNFLENIQESQINQTNLIENNITQTRDYNLKKIFYYTISTILIISIIYYFTSGGGNNEALTDIYSIFSQEISQKIITNTTIIDNNMKYMLETMVKNDNHLVDVIDRILIKNNEQIYKIISIRIFNAILKNGRHLEDITKILENLNLTSTTGATTPNNLKKVIFSDES